MKQDKTEKRIRLSKALALAGAASRRAAELLIFDGRVQVNGEIAAKPEQHVDPEHDVITIDGTKIKGAERKETYILNKPRGYLCSSKKVNKTPIVIDLFKDIGLRLFTVGRLDKDTEGLLLVSNDGQFANCVAHPSHQVQKEYLVKVDWDLRSDHLEKITKGVRVEGTLVRPIKVVKVRKGTLKITVVEGKKHEVRKLVEAAGLKVVALRRVRIGGLHLGNLPVGKWRKLTDGEKQAVFA